jgi:hypothetical protein
MLPAAVFDPRRECSRVDRKHDPIESSHRSGFPI